MLRVTCSRLWLACFTKEATYVLRVAHNTFVFPRMAGREMATGKGHGEMETGRREGGGGGEERGGDGETGGGGGERG